MLLHYFHHDTALFATELRELVRCSTLLGTLYKVLFYSPLLGTLVLCFHHYTALLATGLVHYYTLLGTLLGTLLRTFLHSFIRYFIRYFFTLLY